MQGSEDNETRTSIWLGGSIAASMVLAAIAAPAQAAFGGLLGGKDASAYPECDAPLSEARQVVEPPPADYAGKARAMGNVAGVVGRFGGLGGLGGALGGAASTAGTAAQVAEYSSLIADGAEFMQAIRADAPSLDGRFQAYGSRIANDADALALAGRSALSAQACYDAAYDALAADIETGDVKRRERSRRYDAIKDGVERTSDLLIDARNRMNTNILAYNDALETETREAGVDLGGLLGIAAREGLAQQALIALDQELGQELGQEPGESCGDVFDAHCARRQTALRARANGNWGTPYTSAESAGTAGGAYGLATGLAVQGAVATGNAAGALGVMGAVSAAPTVIGSFSALTSTNRDTPVCTGIDDGAALHACLQGGATTMGAESIEQNRFVMSDLATLGLTGGVSGSARTLATGLMAQADGGATIDEATVEQLARAGEVSGRYLEVNRGLNQADLAQGTLVQKVARRPW